MPDEYILISQVQEFFGPGAKPLFGFFNTLWGLGLGYLLPAIIFWLGGRKIGFRAGLFTDFSGSTTTYAKWLVAEPRPFYVSDAFTPFKVSTGFGMPSGNAQGIATLMVTISMYARRFWVWILATILILFVGLARLFYGVHSPSQVVWGWIAGIAIALLFVKIADPFVRWFQVRSIGFQLGSVLILALLMTLVGVAIDHIVLQNFVVPEAWIERYSEIAIATAEEDPFTLFNANESYAIGGYILGYGVAGIMLLRDLVPETGTGFGKAVNLGLGLGLLYAFRAGIGAFAEPLRGTFFFPPYLVLVCALIPVVIYTLTPWATARLLVTIRTKRS